MSDLQRDFVGYGRNPPDPKWPGGARLALNFVMNYEEGSEPSIQDGEDSSETWFTESSGLNTGVKGRDLAAEGLFEYGSRVGFWRVMRLFQERSLPATIYGCALALERNPDACCEATLMTRPYWRSSIPAKKARVTSIVPRRFIPMIRSQS